MFMLEGGLFNCGLQCTRSKDWGHILVRQESLGEEDALWTERKPIHGPQQDIIPARQRKGIQPEASLAW